MSIVLAFPSLQPAFEEQVIARPLSMFPLQSSSRLLQVSAAAPEKGLQVFPPHEPAKHVSVPVFPAQIPVPHVVPLVKLSSMLPSQSLSILSHISAEGTPSVALHCVPEPSALHTKAPVLRQAPTPTVQELPLFTNDSSICPLQLLSRLSQTSVM